MTQELTAARAAQPSGTGAAASSEEAGSHAVRLEGLVPAEQASVSQDEGLMLYRDMTLGRRF